MRLNLAVPERASMLLGAGLLLAGMLLAACEQNMGDFDQISVKVTGAGDGTGTVSASDPAVDIDCTLTAGTGSGACSDKFPEAGQGGGFVLTATPAADSRFDGFAGCNSVAGNVCTLSFTGTGNNGGFSVVATFNLLATPPPATDIVTLYNSASVSVYLFGPNESANLGTLLASHGSREVLISTTVGSQDTFEADLSAGTAAKVITCTVTATAWENDTHPLVVFYNNEGNYLTCSDGLVAP